MKDRKDVIPAIDPRNAVLPQEEQASDEQGESSRDARGLPQQGQLQRPVRRRYHKGKGSRFCSPSVFILRRLRATFVTAMRDMRADFADLQAYIGQASTTILSAHYNEPSFERLKAIADPSERVYEGEEGESSQRERQTA